MHLCIQKNRVHYRFSTYKSNAGCHLIFVKLHRNFSKVSEIVICFIVQFFRFVLSNFVYNKLYSPYSVWLYLHLSHQETPLQMLCHNDCPKSLLNLMSFCSSSSFSLAGFGRRPKITIRIGFLFENVQNKPLRDSLVYVSFSSLCFAQD